MKAHNFIFFTYIEFPLSSTYFSWISSSSSNRGKHPRASRGVYQDGFHAGPHLLCRPPSKRPHQGKLLLLVFSVPWIWSSLHAGEPEQRLIQIVNTSYSISQTFAWNCTLKWLKENIPRLLRRCRSIITLNLITDLHIIQMSAWLRFPAPRVSTSVLSLFCLPSLVSELHLPELLLTQAMCKSICMTLPRDASSSPSVIPAAPPRVDRGLPSQAP